MKGINRFGGFHPDVQSLYGKGKPGKTAQKSRDVLKSDEKAADYEMSDLAKKKSPKELKEFQKEKMGVSLTENKSVAEGIELSEAAKNLLAELKEKYGDIDFFVADFSTDEEAQEYHKLSTKKYSCVIDPQTLEQMAADEQVKEKYVGIIDSADEQFDKIKEELGEDASAVTRMGINVDKDGVVSYFAEVTKTTAKNQKAMLEAQKARKAENKEMQEKLEKKRAEKKKEADKEDKQVQEKGPVRLEASSAEELLRLLKEAVADKGEAAGKTSKEEKTQSSFNMSV